MKIKNCTIAFAVILFVILGCKKTAPLPSAPAAVTPAATNEYITYFVTDEEGVAILNIQEKDKSISVNVSDAASESKLAGMKVHYLVLDNYLMIKADDPNNVYASSVTVLPIASLDEDNFQGVKAQVVPVFFAVKMAMTLWSAVQLASELNQPGYLPEFKMADGTICAEGTQEQCANLIITSAEMGSLVIGLGNLGKAEMLSVVKSAADDFAVNTVKKALPEATDTSRLRVCVSPKLKGFITIEIIPENTPTSTQTIIPEFTATFSFTVSNTQTALPTYTYTKTATKTSTSTPVSTFTPTYTAYIPVPTNTATPEVMTPFIVSYQPAAVPCTTGKTQLRLIGKQFKNKPVIYYVLSGQLPVIVPDADVFYLSDTELVVNLATGIVVRDYSLYVVNSGETYPGSGSYYFSQSNTISFRTVFSAGVSSMSPNPVPASTSTQTVIIDGWNFESKPKVILGWSGVSNYVVPDARVTYINASRITINITTGLTPENWTMRLENPSGIVTDTFYFSSR